MRKVHERSESQFGSLYKFCKMTILRGSLALPHSGSDKPFLGPKIAFRRPMTCRMARTLAYHMRQLQWDFKQPVSSTSLLC